MKKELITLVLYILVIGGVFLGSVLYNPNVNAIKEQTQVLKEQNKLLIELIKSKK